MSETIRFKLPNNKILAEILKFVPSNWSWIDGIVYATQEHYERNIIAKNTRLVLSRFYPIKPMIIGAADFPYENRPKILPTEKHIRPRIDEVLLWGKQFSSVVFDEAAFESSDISFAVARDVACGFVQAGYKGIIRMYSGCKYDNPESFGFTHSNRDGPEHIWLEWNKKYSGKQENLEQILNFIRTLKLEEIKVSDSF